MKLNTGIFIDFDNVAIPLKKRYNTTFRLDVVLKYLESKGDVLIKKAYADWGIYQESRIEFMESGFELNQLTQFRATKHSNGRGKNGGDIALTLDLWDIARTNAERKYHESFINCFAIVAGDTDYIPLLHRLAPLGFEILLITLDECKGNLYDANLKQENLISYNKMVGLEPLLEYRIGLVNYMHPAGFGFITDGNDTSDLRKNRIYFSVEDVERSGIELREQDRVLYKRKRNEKGWIAKNIRKAEKKALNRAS
ncbi:MAG: NYN domain-containing protein [Bacteroidetes bacterium]|nr:NYN domain-containing protein [Bacteroidota bacterium]